MIRAGKLLYRKIRYRKGHGVHSPFVYNLITKVIEERCPYYRFHEIELLRKQLRQKSDRVSVSDHKGRIRKQTIAEIVKREAVSPGHGALLFRLTNYFRPENILQIGTSVGLSTLYLTSYRAGLNCISLDNIPAYASISKQIYEQEARTPIDLRTGRYEQLLPGILEEINRLDFVFFNIRREQNRGIWLFNECSRYVNRYTVFVFEEIKADPCMRELWGKVQVHPKVTVTIDLFSMGIVFFNERLHKRNYKVYFNC